MNHCYFNYNYYYNASATKKKRYYLYVVYYNDMYVMISDDRNKTSALWNHHHNVITRVLSVLLPASRAPIYVRVTTLLLLVMTIISPLNNYR